MLRSSDRELVTSAVAGDSEAFAELMRRHTGRVYRFAAAALGDHRDAQDATQETFIEAYRCASRFDGRASVGAWLLGIASNRCRYRRRRRRRPETSLDALADSPGGELSDAHMHSDPQTHVAGVRIDVRRAVGRLQDEHRLPLLLRVQQGLTYEEIAEALDISPGAAAMRVYRGKVVLRRLLSHLNEGAEVTDR